MQITGIVRPSETREITVEAEDYQGGRAKLEAPVPEGWQLIQINTPRASQCERPEPAPWGDGG